ncbi:MAG: hypothetical protein QOD92_1486 [Acidimicrobiaceae bacterium]
MKRAVVLLVWSLAVVAVDGVVIARDRDPDPATRSSAPALSTTTSATASTTTTTTSAEGSESTTSTTVSTSTESPTSVEPTSSATGEPVIAHLQGDGDTPSKETIFRVEGRWQLRWHVDQSGNGAAAVVRDDSGGDQGFFLGLDGDGSIDREDGCSCTLQVTPDGSAYDVVVVDLEG